MGKTDDPELIARCLDGDRNSFEMLLIRYEKPVFNAAFRMLHNKEDARDVTQTVFLKVYENLDKYDSRFRVFSWIYRIAMNEAIDCLNKRDRTETIEDESTDPGSGPEQETSNAQLRNDLQTALMSIKPEYRTVVVLKHFLDCSYFEISEILDLPEKTVKSRLFAGRQLLKDALTRSGTC